jgi:vancomycin resistance protein YoaR
MIARVLAAALLAAVILAGVAWPRGGELGSYRTSLEGRTPGQRRNATLSARSFGGVELAPGETFSFNRHVGSWTADRGYVKAPVSYNGQLLVSWGGGVCQTSTTLYNAALLAGLEVTERHRHEFAPSYVPPGRDAAVAFEALDLRLRNPYQFPVTLTCDVSGDAITVRVTARKMPTELPRIEAVVERASDPATIVLHGAERTRVRNSGRKGFRTSVWRVWHDRRELVSRDTYPVMHRIEETTSSF